jgi:omega-6 fatty acid desaturase (delta-12 desaturase)
MEALSTATTPREPASGESGIRAASHRRALAAPLVLFGAAAGLYAGTWFGIFRVHGAARLVMSLLNGFFVGTLFVIAHDACHGVFVSRRWLNPVLGRLAFLPSLHAFSFWELVHNRLHHGWTNFKPKDYVWAPFSTTEFERLGWARRLVERVGRTAFGVALHYIVVIWWSRIAFPGAADRERIGPVGRLDRFSVLAFFGVETLLAFELESRRGGAPVACALDSFALGVAIPFLFFSWLIGLVTFLHHNNERVRWYDRREDWSFAKSSLHGTVHVTPPKVVDLLLLNIMFHTAHHVDTGIPLYRLPRAQSALEASSGAQVIRVTFTVGGMLATLRRCKLYDYRRHRWLDFAGNPTTD